MLIRIYKDAMTDNDTREETGHCVNRHNKNINLRGLLAEKRVSMISGNLHFSFIVFPGFVKRLFQILRRNKAQSVESFPVIKQPLAQTHADTQCN